MTITEHERTEVVSEREQRARLLEAAALEIEVRGWTRGKAVDKNGSVCLMGAIGCALYGDVLLVSWDEVMDAWSHEWAAEFVVARNSPSPLAQWNDYWAHDAADVTFVLRWRAQEIRDGR